jgi:hypothetical protein
MLEETVLGKQWVEFLKVCGMRPENIHLKDFLGSRQLGVVLLLSISSRVWKKFFIPSTKIGVQTIGYVVGVGKQHITET